MKMKIIVVAVIVLIFISSCTCVQNQVEGNGTYKDLHGRKTRKLQNTITVGGKNPSPGNNQPDHTCPPHNYPCTADEGN
jgi:hypothetical protein